MRDLLLQAVKQFRLGMTAGGSDSLRSFLESLRTELERGPPERAHSLIEWFRQAHEAQERGDYLRVADLLEYEILPRL